MRGHGLWWAAALVIATNVGAWGAAALNRSGEPEAVLDLTERELRLPPKEAENTSLALGLVFERVQHGPVSGSGRPQFEDAGWFDRTKLQAIGFDCRLPTTPENAPLYRAQPPRSTFAALEFEGETWRAQIQAARETDRLLDTHLVAVDVDNDPTALRGRHPDRRRVAIVTATATLQFVSNPGRPTFLMGLVTQALPVEINVPRQWMPTLEGFQAARASRAGPAPLHEPRYRVTVKWGRHFEPWIAGVQALASTPPR